MLHDIKAQYDSAVNDLQKYTKDANDFQTAFDNLQKALNKKYRKIHELCYNLSKICSRFNFVDELHANIQNLKLEARTIRNKNMRDNAEMEIQKLIKLVNDLTANNK